MKRKIIVLILAAIMLLCTSVFAVIGCGTDGDNGSGSGDTDENKLDYSITVLTQDRDPIEGVVVSWQQAGVTKGSATTGADGKATTKLAAGEYNVALSELYAGYVNPQGVTVNAEMREVSLKLQTVKVTYTAEVKDKHGAAASGVKVSWTKGDKIETETTGADGKASCELDYGDYTVTVSDLPEENIFTDSISVTGEQPNAIFELRDGKPVEYTVSVRSAGGLKFAETTVYVYSNGVPIYTGTTDANGELKFTQAPGNYTADVPATQKGYTVTKKAQLTENVLQSEIVLTSSVITADAPRDKIYKIGDIIHDYEWTTPYEVNGRKVTYSIADILEEKQVVVINNWGTKCTYCVQEMPAMDEVYQTYKDDIELLAISNYNGGDSESTIASYREANNYAFPMVRDTNSFVVHFQITNFPTTIIIDRYGAIAHIETGAIPDAEIWERLIKRYVGDNYTQTFTPGEESTPITTEISKPDITVPADHYEKVAAAVNKFEADDTMSVEWFGETKNEYYWPFILKTEEGVSETDEVLCSSNSGKPNSRSALYAIVNMPVGKVLTFDYWAYTEQGADVLSVIWDGRMLVRQISGNSQGWKTCYLYSELSAGAHWVAFAYVKDNTRDVGKDNVYIRNVRFENVADISGNADMRRGAAYGVPEENADKYPHYAKVEIASDGYYHVKRDQLENSGYAGSDPSPMLFVNLMDATNFSNYSINTLVSAKDEQSGEYEVDCTLTVNNVTRDYRPDLLEYCRIAAASDIEGLMPVDQELRDLLVAFTAKLAGESAHADKWLELCYFYSHYGTDGEFIGNPIIGLTKKTAIPVELDTVTTAECTRIMAPFPSVIYAFTPAESAVYKIESLLSAESEDSTQMWLYDDATDSENPLVYNGDNRFIRTGENEQNFVVYRYLQADHTYYIEVAYLMNAMGELDFKLTSVGQSYTELVACCEGEFDMILDEDGETIIGLELAGAVTYYKDDDGYYRVGDENDKHDDDPYIYFDVKYPSLVSPTMSITQLVEQNLKIPQTDKYCDYNVFDLRYRIAYYYESDDYATYNPKFDLTKSGVDRDFKDYTDIVKGYIAAAQTGDETDGLVKVDEDIVKFLSLYIETRVNPLSNNEYEEAMENDWLRLCWYFRTHNAERP